MNTFNKFLITTIVVGFLGVPAYSQSRDMIQLQKDVLDLKNTLAQLQTSVDEKNQAILSLVTKMADQVNSLTVNVQKINQTVDNVNSHTDKSAGDLSGQIGTLNSRVNDLTDTVTAIRSQLGGLSQQMTAKTEALPGPDESWRTANLDVTVGNYDLAIQELSDFQNKYPNDSRSALAQRLKGDALYQLKKYDQAIVEYDTFLQKYPESDDTKAALFKKGLAQADSGDSKGAVATLQQVVSKYKGTIEATNAQAKLKELATPGTRRPPKPGRQN